MPWLRLFASRLQVICPLSSLISDFPKNILVPTHPKSILELLPSHPTEGRIAIVTDAGRDAWTRQRWARDGIAGRVSRERTPSALTTDANADGEVVWS